MTLLEVVIYGTITFVFLIIVLAGLIIVGDWLWEKADRIINS